MFQPNNTTGQDLVQSIAVKVADEVVPPSDEIFGRIMTIQQFAKALANIAPTVEQAIGFITMLENNLWDAIAPDVEDRIDFENQVTALSRTTNTWGDPIEYTRQNP